ncbi:hypothetical protein UFOVP405_7 [uncultured Caudovirales phage]|uniref:Uncharacterized protein n=1 Tax=uncultured Caudovirales phage TaxID=2100421 RepID=A0A6J5M4T5_9CAUD|nr:hypothetical protein UFOVP405_7 [uncultured Caudovirales phage]
MSKRPATTKDNISPFEALDYIRDNAKEYSIAKAHVIYMTEYRKTIKAKLMASCREKTESAKETYAYSHEEYELHLAALAQAVQEAEFLRWRMIGAEAKIEVWRSLEATNRTQDKLTQ